MSDVSQFEQRVAALVDNGLSVPAAREVASGDLTAVASLLRTMAHVLDEQAGDAPAASEGGT